MNDLFCPFANGNVAGICLRTTSKINAEIPESLSVVLDEEVARTKTDTSSIITAALAQYLRIPIQTLFQVSTSGALGASMQARSACRGFLNMGTLAWEPLQILMEKWSSWTVMFTKFRVLVVSQRLSQQHERLSR